MGRRHLNFCPGARRESLTGACQVIGGNDWSSANVNIERHTGKRCGNSPAKVNSSAKETTPPWDFGHVEWSPSRRMFMGREVASLDSSMGSVSSGKRQCRPATAPVRQTTSSRRHVFPSSHVESRAAAEARAGISGRSKRHIPPPPGSIVRPGQIASTARARRQSCPAATDNGGRGPQSSPALSDGSLPQRRHIFVEGHLHTSCLPFASDANEASMRSSGRRSCSQPSTGVALALRQGGSQPCTLAEDAAARPARRSIGIPEGNLFGGRLKGVSPEPQDQARSKARGRQHGGQPSDHMMGGTVRSLPDRPPSTCFRKPADSLRGGTFRNESCSAPASPEARGSCEAALFEH
eukprot:TRINITY_DN45462_c0_g1_i1.p1 TRINITY_DN45462_c0_g1~~TRINITY_DN45462_c0_g1_i1.p1  ORF type:complete len:351 (-),score=32.68 TRINITY_DN45462_c0_g1_i1:99-1151(-)